MKFSFVKSSLVTLVTLLATNQFAMAQERVVALVDDHMIMESQVKRHMNRHSNHQKALEATIDDYLIQKAVKDSGVHIEYQQVNQVIENIIAQNGITYGQLLDALDYQGISFTDYAQKISDQMLMDQVRQVTIGKSVKVDPKDVQALAKQMLEKAKTKGSLKNATAKQYRISHILIKANPILNDAQAKQKLMDLKAQINAGSITFEKAAEENSLDYISAADGGDLGWNFPDVYDPRFAKRIKSSKLGVISAPFQSKFGWHILKVTDTRQKDTTKEVYLQKAYRQLFEKQAREYSKDWVKALRKNARIEYISDK
ncbi:peptidylprolyl isomerase [Phocoenobacter skyensis]|uniref:Peptidyl-prolyl cis-trans isomerase SurA n=1 Tax=Phocoenobacter skyensis TaxID=97481 RepID=A0A1H7U0A4_9PAST|nr:peptidylprolyl isomerase [Pasteurella skyensis]MDP8078688.1 peptidylprolyl isomerase [Pasteurella skyensis]MDP8084682.1 peptidylprolyl isomerase [Pasteurella skyensis]MDP8184172.1 peptidylprolyl isomerase [Pasteurella skyensis]QLB22828.1 peptidylprolyl isomerase [Pasteurella skyensis]SEL90219.1 peptidyl-prolyl cis-trans isomerase SurA [Pasteurella skyensis]